MSRFSLAFRYNLGPRKAAPTTSATNKRPNVTPTAIATVLFAGGAIAFTIGRSTIGEVHNRGGAEHPTTN